MQPARKCLRHGFTSRHRELDTDGGHDDVDREQHHEGEHHGLVDRVADTGRTTADRDALVAGAHSRRIPKTFALISERRTSERPVAVLSPVTNAPAETCWTYTVKKNAPARPTTVTAASSAKATVVAASTRGTTSLWIGLMPSTRIASSSSRIVRAPRSAHIAVEPAPETTSTVTIGAIWLP